MSKKASADPDLDAILKLAGKMADAAFAQTLARFRTNIAAVEKDDDSPVTEADRAAERVMRDLIEKHRPDDGIFGEEYGVTNPEAETVWILDPIDGTKAFVTGKPTFGTLIGVVHKGEAIAGIMDSPATEDRWIGAKGYPTTFNNDVVATRPRKDIGKAWLTTTSPDMFNGSAKTGFDRLSETCAQTTYGSDCQGYGFLACGWLDLVCEDQLAPYDYAALIPIVEGAGGTMTDWQGKALTFGSVDGNNNTHSVLAAGNKDLHAIALSLLNGA